MKDNREDWPSPVKSFEVGEQSAHLELRDLLPRSEQGGQQSQTL